MKVNPDVKFGEFANAFRIVEEAGEDCFLDFMVYSAQEKEATVVARVRVPRDFLPAIQERLVEAITQQEAEDVEELGLDTFRKKTDILH